MGQICATATLLTMEEAAQRAGLSVVMLRAYVQAGWVLTRSGRVPASELERLRTSTLLRLAPSSRLAAQAT